MKSDMKYKLMGDTGVKVSQLCLGTMSFGGAANDDTSRALFSRALDAGINHFDTANVYSKGRSEELLGSFVEDSGCRDRVIIASKGYLPVGRDPNHRGSTRFHLIRAVEDSLRRLRTDRIDIYYLHRFDDLTPLDESLRTLDHLVQQGKILYPAVSNHAAWQVMKGLGIAALRGWSRIAAVQPMYNLAKRQVESEILPLCAHENLAVFPYSPLGGGLLTGKYGAAKTPERGRLVDNKMYQVRYGHDWIYSMADAFSAVADELGVQPASLAVAWVGAHPAVTAPIVGARNISQLEGSLASIDVDMNAELRSRIAALSPAPAPATDRNEERTFNYGVRKA